MFGSEIILLGLEIVRGKKLAREVVDAREPVDPLLAATTQRLERRRYSGNHTTPALGDLVRSKRELLTEVGEHLEQSNPRIMFHTIGPIGRIRSESRGKV